MSFLQTLQLLISNSREKEGGILKTQFKYALLIGFSKFIMPMNKPDSSFTIKSKKWKELKWRQRSKVCLQSADWVRGFWC